MSVLSDSVRIAWIDMRFIKRNILVVLLTSCISPLLYLFAFGYGLGKGMVVDGVDYISFMIPGIISLSTLTSSFNTVASKVMIQRTYYHSFDELYICSMNPSAIALGKSYMGVMRGVLSCMIIYGLGILICDDMVLSPVVILLVIASSLSFSLLGMLAGLLSNSHLTLTMLNSLLILPMTFFCGTIFSLDSLPSSVSAIISLLPLTHVTDCIRAAALGYDIPSISLVVLFVSGIVFFLLTRAILVRNRD